jgi:S1-C subfamily serine protease
MKALRPFVWAAFLVAGFLWITGSGWNFQRLWRPVSSVGRLWSEPTSAQTAGQYSADEQNNIDIYKAAHDATVNITSVVYQTNFFLQRYQERGAGSGFIINPDGQILTNYHVVSGNAQLTVTLSDKKSYKATVLGFDQRNDLALIKIDAGRKLPALKLGDSQGLVVGQKVLAIGNPFGIFGGTLTTGVVSSLDRSIQTEEENLEGMIQTDAAINPGNSGGPLLDSHGNVIGINTAIFGQGNLGLGFALPVNRAKAMLDDFTRTGNISPPTLGITTVPISGGLAEYLNLPASGGLLIQAVEAGSPAEEYGLRGPTRRVIVSNYQFGIGGDLIVAVEGKPVEGTETLQQALSTKRGGDWLVMTVYRNGRREDVKVKLGSAPQRVLGR